MASGRREAARRLGVLTALVAAGAAFCTALLGSTPAASEAGSGPTSTPFPPVAATPAPPSTPVVIGAAEAPVPLLILHDWEDDQVEAATGIVAEYVRAHPNVSVRLDHYPYWALDIQIHNMALGAPFPYDGAADIIGQGTWAIGPYVQWHAVDPITGIDGVDAAFVQQTYAPVAARAVTYDGAPYGLPVNLDPVPPLVYNKRLISDADLPRTLDALRRGLIAYPQSHPGQSYAVWNPRSSYFNAWLFYSAGAPYVDAAGHPQLTTPAARAAAAYLRSLQGLLPAGIDDAQVDARFQAGQAAITFPGPRYPWYYADLRRAGIDFGLAPLPEVGFPGISATRPFVDVYALLLMHGSRHPVEAVDLMKYLTARAAQIRLAQALPLVPANRAAGTAAALDPERTALYRQAAGGFLFSAGPYLPAAWAPMDRALAALAGSEEDPPAVLATAQVAVATSVARLQQTRGVDLRQHLPASGAGPGVAKLVGGGALLLVGGLVAAGLGLRRRRPTGNRPG